MYSPLYFGWSWKNFVLMQLSASLAACSLVGSSTSQVAKLHRQKYCPGMPAVCITSSKLSFFNPANLLILMSTTISKIMWGSRTSDISGIGKMILSWKYEVYLPTLSLSYSSRLFCRTFQEAGVALSVGFCPGGIGLCEEIDVGVFEEPWRSGQLEHSLLVARSSSLAGKASLVVWDIWQPSEGSGEAPKRICELLVELMGELLISGSFVVAKGNQEGRVQFYGIWGPN